MKTIQFAIALMIMLTASAAIADTITAWDSPASIYDTLHARLAVDQPTGRAYMQVFLVDEAYHNACLWDQAVMRGMYNSNCTVKTENVLVPDLAYDQTQKKFTYKGTQVGQEDLITNVYYQRVDTGIRKNSVKYLQVKLRTP
jgi:hypothetical protein